MLQKCVTSTKWMSHVFPLGIPKTVADAAITEKQWLLQLHMLVEIAEPAKFGAPPYFQLQHPHKYIWLAKSKFYLQLSHKGIWKM